MKSHIPVAPTRLLLVAGLVVIYSTLIAYLAAWDKPVLTVWNLLAGLLLVIVIINFLHPRRTLLRNFPVVGYIRFLLEKFRPEIRQYFIESDSDGKPFSRRQRTLVYTRAKDVKKTVPFGTQEDTAAAGYEWTAHSAYPVTFPVEALRIQIGGRSCRQPYSCSLYNIGAMSYGALSKTAIQALNQGAAKGNFAHNTGEGGISGYHLTGGDLIWQIGTGYFGCRDKAGRFDDDIFRINALRPEVKMIEVKLSQGAKPGSGGILPAAKNTWEVSMIRNVRPGEDIISPPAHAAFSGPESMLLFLERLRNLSEGKPVGIKLCIGRTDEFEALCVAMTETRLLPDFICVDGAEGGTGSAPPEFSDHLGMPLADALAFVDASLKHHGLREEIRIIAAGKIISGFDMMKHLALGADAFYSARGMMFSLGCIQALVCDSGTCPVGIATQNRYLYEGLDVSDKTNRVLMFHRNTMQAFVKLMEACGYASVSEINLNRFYRRMPDGSLITLQEIYRNRRGDLLPAAQNSNYESTKQHYPVRQGLHHVV